MAEVDTKNIEIEQNTIEKEQKTEQIKNKDYGNRETEFERAVRVPDHGPEHGNGGRGGRGYHAACHRDERRDTSL